MEITDAIEALENINAYLYSVKALRVIFDVKVSKNMGIKFQESYLQNY